MAPPAFRTPKRRLGQRPLLAPSVPELPDLLPLLVGSYQRVAEELGRYLRAGVSTVILDVPASGEELEHISVVFADSRRLAHA